MFVGTTSLLALDGSVSQQVQQPANEYEFQGVADLMGPAAAKPDPGSEFFDDKEYYWYRYDETDDAGRWFISQADDVWTDISMGTLVDGRLAISDNLQIHWLKDELFEAGPEGVQLSVGDATQDIVIQNPSGSGNIVSVLRTIYSATGGTIPSGI